MHGLVYKITQFLEAVSRALVLSGIVEYEDSSFRVIPFHSEHPDAVDSLWCLLRIMSYCT